MSHYKLSQEDLENNVTHVDMFRLEWEWFRQPELVRHWAMKEADARRAWTQSKDRLEIVEAEIELDIRLHPKKYNLPDRTTEKMIAATVVINEHRIKANKKVAEAKYALDRTEGVMRGLDHKKKALESNVTLFLRDYWSKPKEPDVEDGETRSHLDNHKQEAFKERNHVKRKRKSV